MALLSRIQPLHLYAPAALEEIIRLQLLAANSTFPYEVIFHALEDIEGSFIHRHVSIQPFKTTHRIPCWGFVFTEVRNLRSVIYNRAKVYEIPYSYYQELQQGKDFITAKGTVVPNDEVTEAAEKPRSYAFAADTRFDEKIIPFVKNADLLYHETTYLKDRETMAFERFHSTTIHAAEIAKRAGVKKLLIGHFSSKYEKLDEFLSEAKDVFEDTEIATEACTFLINHHRKQ